MANWKERYQSLRKKAGGVGGKIAAGAKDSGVTAGGGAAAAVLSLVAAPYLPQSVPYINGGALVVAGHFLRRKYPRLGVGLLGAGGMSLIMEVFQKNPEHAAKLPGATTSSTGQAKGFEYGNAGAFQGWGYDAGALQAAGGGDDAGALQTAGYGDAYEASGFEVG